MKEYKLPIAFYMRDFISHIIGKYIEWLEDSQYNNMPEHEIEEIKQVMQKFQAWLYRTTSN